MWNRQELKAKAKDILRNKNYWNALVVSVLVSIVGSRANAGASFSNSNGQQLAESLQDASPEAILAVFGIIMLSSLVILLIVLALRLLVGNPLQVSESKFYLNARTGNPAVKELSYAFNRNYKNIIKSMFMVDLFIYLWSLLFVIPGIVKGYEYFMVKYIIAENPDMDYKRAFEISKKATYGHKLNMWILDLSFIGWFLLGSLCCGIGTLFVLPYYNATKMELYCTLKEQAIASGYADASEFPEQN